MEDRVKNQKWRITLWSGIILTLMFLLPPLASFILKAVGKDCGSFELINTTSYLTFMAVWLGLFHGANVATKFAPPPPAPYTTRMLMEQSEQMDLDGLAGQPPGTFNV